MHTSLSKKLLAGLLSLVMVLSLVAPSTSAQAASKYTLTDKSSVKCGYTFKYQLKGVSKNQYVKVTRNVSGEKVVYNKKELTKTTKINGTGKTLNLYVTYGDKVANYTGKFTVKIYNKKTNKLVKTIVEKTTVKVPALEITSVEPTTAATGNTGYKYIRVNFSKALEKISDGDIELRQKSTNQLYTVDSVKLSNGNKSADITLKGDASVAGTTFLKAGEIYTVTFNQSGASASLQFELPNYADEMTVTSVSTEKNVIYIGAVGFKAPADYKGNLGELVGRTVTFGYNSDLEMTSLVVKDEKVIYGDMTYYAATSTDEAYYYDNATRETYGFNTVGTTSNAVTTYINAATGKTIAPVSGHYVKLVMNTNGTVRVAVVEPGLTSKIVVTSVKDKTITQDKNTVLNLSEYTIEKDGKYIEAEDLVAGDVVYYDTTNKFADVYKKEVTGTMTTTYTDATTVDGQKYKASGWEYLNNTTNLYTAVTENWLLSLDTTKPVTVTLNRAGKIVLVAGTETNATTSGYYVVTKLGQNFTDKDGDGYTLYLSNGEQKTMVARKDTYKGTWANIGTIAAAANLVKVSVNAKGIVTNVEAQDYGTAVAAGAATTTVNTLDTTSTATLDSTDRILTTGGSSYNMPATTPVYMTSTPDATTGLRTVKVTTLGEMSGSYVATAVNMGSNGVTYIVEKSNVVAIVMTGLTSSSTVVTEKTGLLYTLSTGTNVQTGQTDELRDITLFTNEGVKKYNAVPGLTKESTNTKTWAEIKAINDFVVVTLGLDKDGNVASVTTDSVAAKEIVADTGSNSSITTATPDGTADTIEATEGALIINITEDAYVNTTIADINSIKAVGGKNITSKEVYYHKAFGTAKDVIADVIIVNYVLAGETPSVAGTITQDAAGTELTMNIPSGKLVKSFEWYKDGEKVAGATKNLSISAMATYACILTFSDNTTATYTYKPTQVVTGIDGAGAAAVSMTNPGSTTMTGVTVIDQFGDVVKNATLTVDGFAAGGMTGVTGVSLKSDENGVLVVTTTGTAAADGACTMTVLGKTLTLTTSSTQAKLAVTTWA